MQLKLAKFLEFTIHGKNVRNKLAGFQEHYLNHFQHEKKQKILKAKGELVNTNGPEFFKAASVEWCTQNKIKFMVWASSADEWPGRGKIDQQIEIVDESLQFLMAWKQLDEIEALREAHDFGVEINGATDHDARAEAAFEASLEANK